MLLAFGMILQAQTESRLFRFPSIHGNQVVFTYAGDLYTVGKVGGVARKLTNDAGYEMGHCEKVPRGLLVTSGNSPEVFDLTEEAFDQMALFVEVSVVGNRGHTIGF